MIAKSFKIEVILITLLVSMAVASGKMAWAAEPKDAGREYIERIVEEYLLKKPEIIRRANELLAEREESAKQVALKKILDLNREQLERDPGSPVGGNPDGDVTLVEFLDYNCRYCKLMAPRIRTVSESDGRIRIIYKHLPILGASSIQAARATLAAGRQGKYLEYHDGLIEMGEITEYDLQNLSLRLGIDHQKLRVDMNEASISQQLERDGNLAMALDVAGTPGFVIGSRMFYGAVEQSELEKAVNAERK